MSPYLHQTIYDLLATQAGRHPDAIAIETAGGISLTYGELMRRTRALMRALHVRGVARASRVAIVLPNGADLAVSMLAVSTLATSVPLNPIYRRDEYLAYFGEIRVTHLLTLRNFPSEARAVAKEADLPIIELADDGSMNVADEGKNLAQSHILPEPLSAARWS